MNDRECFLATTEHRRPTRVLAYADFTPDLKQRVQQHVGEGVDIAEHYSMQQTSGVLIRKPDDVAELDFSRYWENDQLPEGTVINSNGCAQVPSGFYHFFGFVSPLRDCKSLDEIENYPMHDMSSWDTSYLAKQVSDAQEAGRIVIGWVGHMYETAWQIRGYEQFLMDMIDRPSWAHCLLQRLADNNLAKVKAYAKAGVDLIRCGDDVANQNAMMFSTDMWRKFIHERWAKIWTEAKTINPASRIWYHSDGNIADIVGELIEAGVDILNPLQPEAVDIDAVYAEFDKRLTLDGTIGTQSTMPWGNPHEVRARVREVIDKYGCDGGLIISPTHVLEPEVPLENIDALFDAVREYGTH